MFPRGRRTLLVWLACLEIPISTIALCAQSREVGGSTHMSRATEAYAKEDWTVAAEEYETVVKLDPGNAQALARLGIAYQKLGMLEKAKSSLERALRLDPALPEVAVLLAFVYIELGNYREAVAPLEKALDDTNYDLSVRSVAGQRLVEIYFTLGDEEKGLAVLQKLRQLAPNDADILYAASKVYASLWNKVVQRMLSKTPNSYRIHQVLAEVAEAQGNYAQAAKEYRLIIKMEPQLVGFHYRLGRAMLQDNPTPEVDKAALAEFQKELEINPRDVPSLTEIGQIYLKSHQLQEASRRFSHALELQPSYVQSHVGLGKVLLEQKELQQAAKHFEEAVRLAPEDETAYYNLMIAYRDLGRTAEAKVALDNFQRLTRQKELQRSSLMMQLKGGLGQALGAGP